MPEPIDAVVVETLPQLTPVPRTAKRHRLSIALTVLLDAAFILVGFALAYWMRYWLRWPPPFETIVREVAAENLVSIEAFTPYAIGQIGRAHV